jgi:hypothetical protein
MAFISTAAAAAQLVEIDDHDDQGRPVMMRCQNELTFIRFAPLLIVARMKAPSSGPWTDPTAPNRLVPPMTDDAIACSSQPSACVALPIPMREASSRPTKAAQVEPTGCRP